MIALLPGSAKSGNEVRSMTLQENMEYGHRNFGLVNILVQKIKLFQLEWFYCSKKRSRYESTSIGPGMKVLVQVLKVVLSCCAPLLRSLPPMSCPCDNHHPHGTIDYERRELPGKRSCQAGLWLLMYIQMDALRRGKGSSGIRWSSLKSRKESCSTNRSAREK